MKTKSVEELPFKEEWILVKDLEIDPNIQRFGLDMKKVGRIVKNFRPSALNVVTVSRRNPVTNIILDGWHRHQAVKEVTDNTGEILCHVFEGLTRAQEAQMFLDLNAGNQPSLLEKYRAKLIAEDPTAVGIDEITRSYQWTVSPTPANGNIQCIGTLERIYDRSVVGEYEPNLLQITLLTVTRAWGHIRPAVQAVILEGVSALYSVHTSLIDVDRLINKLQTYPGGPLALHTDATAMAAIRRGRVSMAVADLVTSEYNKGKSSKSLPTWTKKTI